MARPDGHNTSCYTTRFKYVHIRRMPRVVRQASGRFSRRGQRPESGADAGRVFLRNRGRAHWSNGRATGHATVRSAWVTNARTPRGYDG